MLTPFSYEQIVSVRFQWHVRRSASSRATSAGSGSKLVHGKQQIAYRRLHIGFPCSQILNFGQRVPEKKEPSNVSLVENRYPFLRMEK